MSDNYNRKINWHTLCLYLLCTWILPSCYYWRDLDVLESNTPPQILHSDPIENGLMVLNRQVNTAFVVVKDENDPENLRFQWWIGGEGPLGFAEPLPTTEEGFQGSRVSIPADSKYEGKSLNCIVYDSFDASDSIMWIMTLQDSNGEQQ